VFFLGGGYDYIKGGEMERLINVRIFVLFAFGLFRGFALFFTAAALFVIGDIPALALELERTQRNDFFGPAFAVNALGDRFGRDALQGLEGLSAF
jgi:hypothetical protein